MSVLQQRIEYIIEGDDDKFVSKWLNDTENAAWRSKAGRV